MWHSCLDTEIHIKLFGQCPKFLPCDRAEPCPCASIHLLICCSDKLSLAGPTHYFFRVRVALCCCYSISGSRRVRFLFCLLDLRLRSIPGYTQHGTQSSGLLAGSVRIPNRRRRNQHHRFLPAILSFLSAPEIRPQLHPHGQRICPRKYQSDLPGQRRNMQPRKSACLGRHLSHRHVHSDLGEIQHHL